MDNRFTRQSRLLKASQFQSVFAKAQFKASDKYVLLLANPNSENRNRIGLVVGKKKIKRAVDRNRFKRIARETFRHHKSRLNNLDIIVLARPGSGDLSSVDLHKSFKTVWPVLERKSKRARKSC